MAKEKAKVVHPPLKAEVRSERGSRKAQALRAAGRLPGVVYGLHKDVLAISVPATEAVTLIHSGSHTADLELGGQTEKVLIKDVQYDHLDSTIEHVDFLRVDPTQRIEVSVPLEFRGVPKGAKEGGILETVTTEITIEALALEIPDSIRVTVDHLDLHDVIHAREVQLPPGAKLVDDGDQIICTVRTVREEVVAVAAAEAGPAEPEVIGKKKEEDEEGAAAPAAGTKGAAPAKAAAPAAPKK